MSTHTLLQDARGTAVLTMGTLAADTYITSSAIDRGAAIPPHETIEVVADPNGTPANDKSVHIFAQLSLDNTNFSTGPTSGTSNTNEEDLHYIGTLKCNDTSEHTKMMSLDHLPKTRYMKLVALNKVGTGVALTSGSIYYVGIDGVTT